MCFSSGILRQNIYLEYIEQDFLLQSRGFFGHGVRDLCGPFLCFVEILGPEYLIRGGNYRDISDFEEGEFVRQGVDEVGF